METQAKAIPRLGLFRQSDFFKYWTGQTISMIGSQITGVAIPLLAVITLNASPAQMGWFNTFYMLPTLLFSLFTGVWVDRLLRRRLMIWTDLGRAALLGLVPLVAVLGLLNMEMLYAVAFITSTLTVFFDVANMAFVINLVSRERLVEANSKISASFQTAQVVGPGLGGWLIQAVGAPFAVLLDAASFIVSALSLAWIRSPEPPPAAVQQEKRRIWPEIQEGLRVVYQNKTLLSIVGMSATYNFFAGIWWTQWDLYMVRSLHLSPAVIGLLSAANAPAGLFAAVIAERVSRRLGVGRAIGLSSLALGVVQLPILVNQGPTWLLIAAQSVAWFLVGFFVVIMNVNAVSLRQAITPPHLLGRVGASQRFLTWGVLPIASLISGALGTWLGVWPAMAVGVFGGLIAFLWPLFSPVWSLKEIPETANT